MKYSIPIWNVYEFVYDWNNWTLCEISLNWSWRWFKYDWNNWNICDIYKWFCKKKSFKCRKLIKFDWNMTRIIEICAKPCDMFMILIEIIAFPVVVRAYF